jgi:hypothetical protein
MAILLDVMVGAAIPRHQASDSVSAMPQFRVYCCIAVSEVVGHKLPSCWERLNTNYLGVTPQKWYVEGRSDR